MYLYYLPQVIYNQQYLRYNMSTQQPPNPWFNVIDYNPSFFPSSSNISLAYLNANYLRITSGSNPISKSTTTTFEGQLIVNSNLQLSGATPNITANGALTISTQAGGGVVNLTPQGIATNQLSLGTTGVMTYAGNTFYINATNAAIYNNYPGGSLTFNTPNSGGNIYLNSGNVAGMTISTGAIYANLNITLPTVYVAPGILQLGGTSSSSLTTSNQATTTNVVSYQSVTLGIGTWILVGNMTVTNNTVTTFTPNQTGIWFNSSIAIPTAVPYTMSLNGVAIGITNGATYAGTTGLFRNQTTMIITIPTAGTIVYMCHYLSFAGSLSVNVNTVLNYTRLA